VTTKLAEDNDHGIYENLRGTECVCGGEKRAGRSFCRRDYFKLPQELRNALYRRDGYADTFRRALALLGLAEPIKQQTLRDVFPNGGAARRNSHRRR
jgi:hypothetical protein